MKLVGLDRDGTIIKDQYYLGSTEDYMNKIELYPVSEGIKLLNKSGAKVVVISNQSGIAREYFDCNLVEEIDGEIFNQLKQEGAIIDGWYSCPHVDFKYAKKAKIELPGEWVVENPKCRKPNIGMLEEACDDLGLKLDDIEAYVIGDKQIDVQTAKNAGGKGYLVDMENHPEEFLKICKEIIKK